MRNRQQTQLIAEQLLKEDIVILDTETTGLKNDDEIVEISIINADGDILLDTLIKPQKGIPVEAMDIHGIMNADVKNAPMWSDVYEQYKEIVKGKTVVIYNKSYDTRIIRQTCKKYDLPTPRIKSECAMLLYAQYYGEINERTGNFKWHKLKTAVSDNKIKVSGTAHRALTDAQMTLALIKLMAYRDCNKPIYPLHSIYPPINPEYEKYKRKIKEEKRRAQEIKDKLKKEKEDRVFSRCVEIVFTLLFLLFVIWLFS
ncbi:3'-5' exonuclease [Xenorhabdus nematophila]|uniref:3'-5' exonuclease n=1 Tax=Xenorhabdus nematophila TaxID=628 RepID=UPI0032B82E26